MGNTRNNSESMTLSLLCDLIGVSPRKVQYLRETGVVEPTVLSFGRGRACKYSLQDAALVWIAVVELDGMDYEKKRSVISHLRKDTFCGVKAAKIGTFSTVYVDVDAVKKEIGRRAKLTSSLKSSI